MRRSLFERDARLGLASVIAAEALDEMELGRKATDLVELLFKLLKPHSVALFVSTGQDLRLEAIKSRADQVHRKGHTVPLTNTFLGKVLEEVGEVWIKELSKMGRRIVPMYRDNTEIQSVRIVPFPFEPDTQLLLMIDYTEQPEIDPTGKLEPLIDLFSDSLSAMTRHGYMVSGGPKVPIPIFLRRTLTPFIDFVHDFLPVQSLEMMIWGDSALGGEILEVVGEKDTNYSDREFHPIELGSFSFRWAIGSLRQASLRKNQTCRQTRYFPITIGSEIVGNISIIVDGTERYLDDYEVFVKIISWSLEKELRLIGEFREGGNRASVPCENPYSAAIRVLYEWANASRYNEYLSMGLVHLKFEGLDFRRERGSDLEWLNSCLYEEIEDVLRKGDVLVHCSRGNMALIFPRTSPEGANNALRRICNLLEGKKIGCNGSSVRVLSADSSVLWYPKDMPSEEIVLEKCSKAFVPKW